MRLRILSDLHLEFAPWGCPAAEADVVILAGDIHIGKKGLEWIKRTFCDVPVIYVLGNHESYGQTLPKIREELCILARGSNVHILEQERVDIGTTTILGATLWTDFALHDDPVVGGQVAEQSMTDFRRIRTFPNYRKLRASYVRRLHADAVTWLRQQAPLCSDRKLVVVTHHAPSARSLNPALSRDPSSVAYASHLDDLVAESRAALWIHGHTHVAADYVIGGTRVVANQRGYPEQLDTAFNPKLVVEI